MATIFWTDRRMIYLRFAYEVCFAIVFSIFVHTITDGRRGLGVAILLVCIYAFLFYRRLRKLEAKRAAMTPEERALADSPKVFTRRYVYFSLVFSMAIAV